MCNSLNGQQCFCVVLSSYVPIVVTHAISKERPTHDQHKTNKKKEWEDILLKVDSITLPYQREKAADELQSYIDDFLILSHENAS